MRMDLEAMKVGLGWDATVFPFLNYRYNGPLVGDTCCMVDSSNLEIL